MQLHGQEISRLQLERLTGDSAAVGGVREVVLDNGPERGIRALEFRTGTGLIFELLVDRAMDIGPAEHQGRSFGWRSPARFRHPGLHENADEQGFSWLRSMSGLLATGGLDHIGGRAEVDAAQYHCPHRKTVFHGLHGRIANTPARLTGYGERWDGDNCTLWAEGTVRQAEIFGENLELHRRIESALGSDEIRICDVVTNRGFERTPHMILYHTNFGWPLLDKGSRFVAPIVNTRAFTQNPPELRAAHDVAGEPEQSMPEQVYEHQLDSDAHGRVSVMLVNDRLKMGVEMEWLTSELPCFFQWVFLREGTYVMGLEPCSHHIDGDQAARDDGSMIWLNHSDSRTYHVTIRLLLGDAALASAEKRIAGIVR